MTTKPSLDIESLNLSFRDSHNAKSCLEKDLAEKRQQRGQLETTLEAVNGKHTQAKDIQAKMQETRNVAVYKMDRSQALFNSLESSNENKRENLTKLGDEIQTEDEQRENDIAKIEDGLSTVSKMMRNAKTLYNDEQLEKEYEESATAELELEKLGEEYEREFTDTEKQLQELQKEIDQDDNRAYSMVTAEQLLTIFEKAEKDADAYLQQMDKILGQRLVPQSASPAQHQYMDNQRMSCA